MKPCDTKIGGTIFNRTTQQLAIQMDTMERSFQAMVESFVPLKETAMEIEEGQRKDDQVLRHGTACTSRITDGNWALQTGLGECIHIQMMDNEIKLVLLQSLPPSKK